MGLFINAKEIERKLGIQTEEEYKATRNLKEYENELLYRVCDWDIHPNLEDGEVLLLTRNRLPNDDSEKDYWISVSYSTYHWFKSQLLIIGTDGLDYENFIPYLNSDAIDFSNKNPFYYPFEEFTDCDGLFDASVAKEVLEKFNKYEERAKTYADKCLDEEDGDWFMNLYHQYQGILQDCIDVDGVVLYH